MIQSLVLKAALIGLSLLVPPALAEPFRRDQRVLPLPGQLDAVLMVNDNNPEPVSYTHLTLPTICSV